MYIITWITNPNILILIPPSEVQETTSFMSNIKPHQKKKQKSLLKRVHDAVSLLPQLVMKAAISANQIAYTVKIVLHNNTDSQ
jgi:hypothetical protein